MAVWSVHQGIWVLLPLLPRSKSILDFKIRNFSWMTPKIFPKHKIQLNYKQHFLKEVYWCICLFSKQRKEIDVFLFVGHQGF